MSGNETYRSVGEVARKIGARAPDITNLFYKGLLRDDLAPLVGGRRLIPESYIPMIEMALRRAGKMEMAVAYAR